MCKDTLWELSQFVYNIDIDNLNENIIEQTKKFVADYYIASYAGYVVNKQLNEPVIEYFKGVGGKEQSSILFSDIRLPYEICGFINAIYSHGADMDDGNRMAAGHIGTSVISAVFALAENRDICWGRVLEAIIAGYEIFNRISGAAQPGIYSKGFHSTGIVGGMAVAAACGKLLSLDTEQIYNAISFASFQASGTLIIDESGQSCKPINPANAARTGIFSAIMAQKGVAAPRNGLDSKKGWFKVFAGQWDESILYDEMGYKYTICDSYMKLYPTCRHTHSCIEAISGMYSSISGKGIKAITIFIYANAITSSGAIRYPRTPEEAKFSLCYSVAVAVKKGTFEFGDLDCSDRSLELKEIIDKIELVEDSSMENRKAGVRGARVRVELETGDIYEETVLKPKGEGDKELDWQDLLQKYKSVCNNESHEIYGDRLIDYCKDIKLDKIFGSIRDGFTLLMD